MVVKDNSQFLRLLFFDVHNETCSVWHTFFLLFRNCRQWSVAHEPRGVDGWMGTIQTQNFSGSLSVCKSTNERAWGMFGNDVVDVLGCLSQTYLKAVNKLCKTERTLFLAIEFGFGNKISCCCLFDSNRLFFFLFWFLFHTKYINKIYACVCLGIQERLVSNNTKNMSLRTCFE